MLCCIALAGLALFGPHGVRLYRALRQRNSDDRPARLPAEPARSRHLVLAPTEREARGDVATAGSSRY